LFFALRPKRATLSDASSELIETWRSVREHAEDLCDYLQPLKPCKDLFYRIRANRSVTYPTRAGEFIYLNKTCWNGLYRVNGRGEFNVPYGAPQTDFIFDADVLRACSKTLKRNGISLRHCDFEVALRSVRECDLVFLDPPYVTKHNFNGFRDWNEKLFSWEDQVRLAKVAEKLAARGAHVLVSNADHADVAELYGRFRKFELERPSTLASDAGKRGRVTEALFASF
jgi:DNA adenine methylase